ncbi:antibiotic biosynthesis monooxygenase [Paraburkholderia sp. RL17-337-BIB-A]|uniref:antibiotic biosynthesis monooxygenase n=1 Tax=Paraburkholderia sp. RL17-337-BIB-A TaxID=3031636 RepID=UPI0038BBD774
MNEDRTGGNYSNDSRTTDGGATIVTQTRPLAGHEEAFKRWQDAMGEVIATWEGFIEQEVILPRPPAQIDWVILQRFVSSDAAASWLRSAQRLSLVDSIQPILAGNDDIHLVRDGASGVLPAPVSVVISTRVKPGEDIAFRRWEQRIAAVQARAAGFQGYRFEPPVPGVQDDWLAIIRFDSEANLQNWLNSPERLELLKDSDCFTEHLDTRIVRSGFDQWFSVDKRDAAPVPVWKQNMIVLSLLYPVVFLFGLLVQTPMLMKRIGMPFWLALFVGNVVSVVLLNWLVPWASKRLSWWLQPAAQKSMGNHVLGAGVVVGVYAVSLLVCSRL